MWPRFHLADVRVVGHYLGVLVLLTGVAMCIPFLIALLAQEYAAALDFLIGIASCLCAGSVLSMMKVRPGKLSRQQALFVVGLSWVIIAFAASIPMYLSGNFASYTDALFEAVASITTTGFSLSIDYNHTSCSMMIWRAILVFIGGQGVIVVALSLGFFGRTGGAGSVYSAEAHNDHVLPNLMHTARFIWAISGSVVVIGTVSATIVCAIAGMDILDAFFNGFVLTVSAYDTGGITPYSTSLVFYHSVFVELFCLVFSVIGIINFTVFAGLIEGNTKEFFKNFETRTVVIWLSIMTFCLTAVMAGDGIYTGLVELLRRGTFMAVSATTTAGFQTIYSSQMGITFTGGAMVVLLIVMLVGGVSGSTAGGIKVSRIGIIVKWFGATIVRMLLPTSAIKHTTYHQFVDRELTAQIATQAMIIFLLFSFTTVTGGMAGIACGYDAIPAMFESAAAVSNNGMSAGIVASSNPPALKIVYMFQMWFGRLEFIALLALIAGLIASIVHKRPVNTKKKPNAKKKQNNEKNRVSKAVGRKGRMTFCVLSILLVLSAAGAPMATAKLSDIGSTSNKNATETTLSPSIAGAISDIETNARKNSDGTQAPLEVTVSELVSAEVGFDNSNVRFAGEVIGGTLTGDRDHVWVNVNGQGSLIGVYMTKEQAEQIQHRGGYGVKGSELEIVGVFNIGCEQHAGELDVHATRVEIVSPGGQVETALDARKITAAAILLVAGVVLLSVYRRRKRAAL